jgi:endonuclease/exonuclease/phosphatase (EEP) superfamily protein YafD
LTEIIFGIALLIVAGVRLTIQDRWVASGLLFYTGQWIVLAVGCAVASIVWRRKQWAFASAVLMIVWVVSLRGPGGGQPDDSLHLRLWNAQNPVENFPDVVEKVLEDTPDIVVLTDAGDLAAWIREASNMSAWDEYRVGISGWGFVILCTDHFEVLDAMFVPLPHPHSRLAMVKLKRLKQEAPLTVMAVELDYDYMRPKTKLFDDFVREIKPFSGPLLLAGDYNVPPDSVHLHKIKQTGFRSAFQVSGSGMEVSWPWPVPLLGLIQVWGSEEIDFRHSEYGPGMGSDHRKLDVWFKPL